jgi:hypothetical protein
MLALLSALAVLVVPGGGDDVRPRADAARALRTFYVAPRGSDSGHGTRARPFRTLARALRGLRAGDLLYVRGGTYDERIDVKAAPGSPDAGVRVSNYPGERPVVRGRLWIGNPSYWTIRGINVTWAQGDPDEALVRLYGGTGWTLTRSEIWGAHSTAALEIDDGPLNNLGAWAVTHNCIHDTFPTNGVNQDHNIYVADMSASPDPHGEIAHNILFGARNGRGIKLGPGGESGGARNVAVRFNTIYDSSQNVSLSRDTSGVLIERNILAKARQANVTAFMLVGQGNVVRNNVAYGAPKFLDNGGDAGALVDGGGNLHHPKARFDAIGCGGFHTSRPRGFGAYG